jgi:hypothetical protein
MMHENAQKIAQKRAHEDARLDRLDEVRLALADAALLRREAEQLLDAIPRECTDLLAWSAEGYAVALVSAVIADERSREIKVHRASLLAPLAPPLRTAPWTWVCAEELLRFGDTRAWATAWAATRGGQLYRRSGISLVAAS